MVRDSTDEREHGRHLLIPNKWLLSGKSAATTRGKEDAWSWGEIDDESRWFYSEFL